MMRKIKNPWIGKEGYNCFACAPHNENGLKMEFFEEGDEVVSIWKPQPFCQGWVDTLHGGIQAALLDETCAWAVMRKLQTTGVTSKMEIRYLHAISTKDSYLTLRARIMEQKRNIVVLEACIYDSREKVCTKAVCTYFAFSKEKAREEMGFRSCEVEEEQRLF